MANKKTLNERIKADKQKRLNASMKKLNVFPIIGAAVTALVFLLLLVKWACIFNTDIKGNEVQITGYNTLFAAFSGKYSVAKDAYGDMAVPFFYYAPKYCKTLGALTIAAFIATALALAAQIFVAISKKHVFNVAPACFNVVAGALYIACFIVALTMKNSDILPVYCSGNPACSIKSYAIFPALVSFSAVVPSCIATFKYFTLKYGNKQ